MADTTFLKNQVEPNIRQQLQERYNQIFKSQRVLLPTGGDHEFDAVSADGQIIAAIKTAGGKTRTGKNPSGKVKDVEAELYYLYLAEAQIKLLIVTSSEFFSIIERRLRGRLPQSIQLMLIQLPEEIETQVQLIRLAASDEMSI